MAKTKAMEDKGKLTKEAKPVKDAKKDPLMGSNNKGKGKHYLQTCS